MPREMDVSIVIVSWNTRDILRDCLQSVYEQAGDVNFEVIVIDNASIDGSVEMVRYEFPEVTVIENSENRGFAAANNRGIAVAKGRYVLLLNSDTIVLENAIAGTVSFADAHPTAAVVGCRVLNPDKTLQPTCFMFPSLLNMFLSSSYLYKLFPRNRFFGREAMTWWDRQNIREVDVVKGCFMLIRKEAIREVGVMDEQYFMYCEETDWCYRFKRTGWNTLYNPGTEIIHLGGASTGQIAGEMLLQLRASRLIFLRKHKSLAVYTIACLLTAIFFLIRIPYWLGMAIFSGAEKSRCWRRAGVYTRGTFYAFMGGERLLSNWGNSSRIWKE